MTFGLLKEELSVESFCKEFYDEFLGNDTLPSDFWQTFCKTLYDNLIEIDEKFKTIDFRIFKDEAMLIRIELIGLALSHSIAIDLWPRETQFTKKYLESIDHLDSWEALDAYNQIIAESTYRNFNNKSVSRGKTTFLNIGRMQFFEEWCKAGINPKCAARALNRFGAYKSWKNGITTKLLICQWADRINCNTCIQEDVLMTMGSAVYGFYQGAKDAIKKYKIV